MTTKLDLVKTGSHRWSGWPGAWCLDCGCEDPNELKLAGYTVESNHPGLRDCEQKGQSYYDYPDD